MNSVSRHTSPAAGQGPFRRGASAISVRKNDVLSLIEKNFDRFDRDDNGKISWTEMRKNIADPSIKGQDAAALATLYSLTNDAAGERGLLRNPQVTGNFLADLKDERDFALEEGEEVAADLYFQRYLSKLENASDELFAGGLPNAFQIAQGYGPSCAILATTAAQARINPGVIQDAITLRQDGKVQVKFPGIVKPQVIAATTDTETALFASAGKNGTWLNHVEKAWGAMQGSDPGAAFEHSSWPAKSIRAWSAGRAETSKVPAVLDDYNKGDVPSFLQETVKQLASNHIVMTWTRFGDREIDNLVPGHAHTLTAFDSERGTLEVRNPWGHREPLNSNGKPRDGKDDGVFEVTLQEFVTDFGSISQQTSVPKRRDRALK